MSGRTTQLNTYTKLIMSALMLFILWDVLIDEKLFTGIFMSAKWTVVNILLQRAMAIARWYHDCRLTS